MSSGRSSKLIARRGSSDKGCQNTSGFKFLQPSFASNSTLMGCNCQLTSFDNKTPRLQRKKIALIIISSNGQNRKLIDHILSNVRHMVL